MPTAEYTALFGGMLFIDEKDSQRSVEIAAYPVKERVMLVTASNYGTLQNEDEDADTMRIAAVLALEGWAAWPGEDYLIAVSGLSRVELRNALALLVKVGLLVENVDGGYKFSGKALLRVHAERAERRDAAKTRLADAYADDDADAYNLRRIAAETGMSESQVKKGIQELIEKGYIARDGEGAFGFTEKFEEKLDELAIQTQLQLDGKLPLP